MFIFINQRRDRIKLLMWDAKEIEVIEPEGRTEGLAKIGEERTKWVEYTPIRLVKKVFIRLKYAKPQEEGKYLS